MDLRIGDTDARIGPPIGIVPAVKLTESPYGFHTGIVLRVSGIGVCETLGGTFDEECVGIATGFGLRLLTPREGMLC